MKRLLFAFILIPLLLVACQGHVPEATAERVPLTFMAGYKPQANLPFVGAYVAQEKGFFAEQGLDVTIQHSAGGGEHLQLLASGRVDATTQDAAVLLKRRAEPGLPLVSIGLVGQTGQQAFVALQESGIETVQDWAGHDVGYKGTPPPDLLALLAAAGVAEEDVNLVNVGFDPRVLVEGLVDVYPVYKSNEPYLIESWGYALNMWEAADFDVPTLGLAYVTTPDAIAQDPARMERFMAAVIDGIQYAQEHVDEAVAITMQYAGEEADAEHMRFMLETELADATSPVTDAHGLGWSTVAQWQALHDMLWQHGTLAQELDVTAAFTNEFLPGE